MNDVEELKRFATVHARAQDIRDHREVLDRITDDAEDSPTSWVVQWTAAGDRRVAAGDPLGGSRRYAMARFPYVDGPARQRAQDACVAAFDTWRRGRRGIERVDAGDVRCWASGLSGSKRRPLLLVCGGIVSVKEQWAPLLADLGRTGMAGVVAELPGVGENPASYGPDSWRYLSAVLDAVADRADVARTYAVALSFSGHLALRCALTDRRIRGVVTAGAPVSAFFTDPAWQQRLPKVTVDTLAHLTGGKAEGLPGLLPDWALTDDMLAALPVPVAYLASRRDEIIPPADPRRLAAHAPNVRTAEIDDVHASPGHVTESKLFTAQSVLRMRGVRGPRRAVLDLAWWLAKARGRVREGLSDAG
ncbi:MAG: alpha/beta fold hydrolase [Mycobacteriales bacterium]|jgi:esterase FrsA